MTWNRQSHSEYWLISYRERSLVKKLTGPVYTLYRHGEDVRWLSIGSGFAREASGATYGSLLEWEGQRERIRRYLTASDGDWFFEFLDKGIRGEPFHEQNVFEAFHRKNGFSPLKVGLNVENLIEVSGTFMMLTNG